MILSAHAFVGAAAGRLFPQNPTLAFIIGFASHFILDSIPHWSYRLASFIKNPQDPLKNNIAVGRPFTNDLFKIGIDCFTGIALSFYIFQDRNGFIIPSASTLAGISGGLLPDLLQFIYYKVRREPLIILQRFHIAIHNKQNIKNPVIGIASLILTIIIAALTSKLIT